MHLALTQDYPQVFNVTNTKIYNACTEYLAHTFLTKHSAFKDTSCRLFSLQVRFFLSCYCSKTNYETSNKWYLTWYHIYILILNGFFNFPFLPCDATQSAVMPQYIVCPSFCPSVTFRYRDHIGWNSSK